MKTCQPHNYNPPSKCPDCRRTKTRKRKAASKKGWQTRRANEGNDLQETDETPSQTEQNFINHGWLS